MPTMLIEVAHEEMSLNVLDAICVRTMGDLKSV